MTEMLNKEFSRKSFVKGGGALIVGFSVAGAGARRQGAGGRRARSRRNGPFDLRAGRLVASTIHADNTVDAQDGPGRARPGHARPAC